MTTVHAGQLTVAADGGATRAADEEVYLARQPILDVKGSVFGFELLYRGSADADTCVMRDDQATARVLIDALLSLGFETLTDGRPAFINFTRATLLSDVAMQVPPSQLAVEVIETVDVDADVIDACRRLHERGYAVGLDDFVPGSASELLLPYVSFIKMDVLQTPRAVLADVAERFRTRGIRMIAEKVETLDVQRDVRGLGYGLFQGYYFCRPSGVSTRPVSPQQHTYLRLLGALSREDLTVAELEDLVKSDVSLAFRVLRAVNSPALGLCREVTSLRQALVLLGRERVRQWASVWTMAGLSSNLDEQLLTTALIRARCCEAVGGQVVGANAGGEYFLLGLCSLLDAVMKRPMSDVLDGVPLPKTIRDALLGTPNQAKLILDAVLAYARGDWNSTTTLARQANVSLSTLGRAYADALRWSRGVQALDGQ